MIEQARQLIDGASAAVSFSGAGLSAESGLATFRDADGIWARYDPAVYASVRGFETDPDGVSEWYRLRRRSFASAAPNAAHWALATSNMVHVTQNIDTLLEKAGAESIVHLHGVLDRDRCHAQCGHAEHIDVSDPPALRRCPRCNAYMRPDVVWFGENLPAVEWNAAEAAIDGADLLLVVGTSGEVWPAAGLIHSAHRRDIPIVVVNADPTSVSPLATVELVGKAAELLPAILGQNPEGSSIM